MTQKTLSEYVEIHGQTETARRAGLTQGAIWQMLQRDRKVLVTENGDGTVLLEERKPIKRNSTAA
jgi:hypothetical protein